jgi:hypothetical protein
MHFVWDIVLLTIWYGTNTYLKENEASKLMWIKAEEDQIWFVAYDYKDVW